MSLSHDAHQALNLHNAARLELKEDPRPSLRWSHTLERDALSYAQYLANRNGSLKHSDTKSRTSNGVTQGENLAWRSGGEYGLVDASRLWIEEKYLYRGEKIGGMGMEGWGHYTQIIFPTVTKVGIAAARSRTGAVFVVARYDTCQLLGKFPYNEKMGNIFKGRKWDDGDGKGGSGGGQYGGQGFQGFQGYQGFQGFQGYQGYPGFQGYRGHQGYGGYGGYQYHQDHHGYQGYQVSSPQPHRQEQNIKPGLTDNFLHNIGINRHAQASGSASGSGIIRGILNMDSNERKTKLNELKVYVQQAKDGAVKVKGLIDVARKK